MDVTAPIMDHETSNGFKRRMRQRATRPEREWCVRGRMLTQLVDRRVQGVHDPRRADGRQDIPRDQSLHFYRSHSTIAPGMHDVEMRGSSREKRARQVAHSEETPLPTIVAHHKVKDAKHWLASPKRQELFGPHGITNIRTFVDPQDSTRVSVLMDVPDMAAFEAVMKTEAAAEAMAYDGVLPETLVITVEA